ncbi:FHA domain-containing protein At4g14490 isoform X2 [Arabidopsis lyrata subsp. lyrata]|uniref:FHA domain-containing protein At4g14490 isoform X2 n=1 Tax=Arabidopsis lyrata subsp. lyrata TaxID=81972 RepID=UPI000A29DC67|nr:FHA domain-containing protein At4g14490 isoform X2 [Arabidopsis lyrata subsp. lyrata]|eukprot:XP_020886896.1 FHA domain-containing protein At4g14490 isoform X2 [Arabidopsis lyrata subsp. lyrata]
MVPPLLKLDFTQGPRAGDSLGFKPGSTIRIGRFVRGNEIAIKDAGISTKHLRIVSDSENWIIHDLGSSNGTILNSETIDPDTPINLSHGDEIKLGEYTSILVNFVSDVVQAPQEHKLPPRPRRNNKRLAVSDPDPIESVQEKPKRTRGSSKQEENELPKKTRASRKKTLDDIADKEEELEVEIEKKVKSRVGRPRKNAGSAVTKEEEVVEEKKGNSRARRGKNSESVEKLGLNSIKLEVEDTPRAVEISEVKSRKRVARSKQIENACFGLEYVKSEDTALEVKNEMRTTRSTRSKKTELGGDSFLELEMVLNQARKSRAKRKKVDQEPSKSVVEMETINDDAGEEVLVNCHVEEDNDNEGREGCSERSDDKCDKEDEREGDGSKRVEQVEIELRKKSTLVEDGLNCTVREDGETENLQDIEEENDNETQEGCSERSDEKCDKEDERVGDGSKRVEQVEIELRKKSTLGEDDLNCTVREDGETDNLQEIEEECHKKESECKVEEAGIATLDDGCDEEKVEQGWSNKNVERVEVDLGKMKLRDWFEAIEVQLPKQTIEETEKMIEPMRSKSMRVHKHIAEQKEKGV